MAGDVGGVLRQEERDRAGHFFRLAHARHGHMRHQPFDRVLVIVEFAMKRMDGLMGSTSMKPGASALTLMPRGAISLAR